MSITPASRPIPADSDLMDVNEFIRDCKNGSLIDYDGFGYLSKDGTTMTDIQISPSQCLRKGISKKYKFVAWFNR